MSVHSGNVVVLTPEQEAIVAHPLEPLRVVAGAGTGKTTTVVARIANKVDGGLDPETVLGLTFTNKAAEELGDRMRRALPRLSEKGREAEVTTYHGFAAAILHEFGALVGVERGADLIGPGYTRQLLYESLPTDAYRALDLTWPAHSVSDAALLARRLADNLATPADVRALAPAKADAVWDERLELAGIVERYDKAKRRLGALDYGDLVRLACQLVTTYREVRSRIRARYELLVLDEYQDTDPAQRTLLQAIFGDGFPVTAVGDEDQTIYEWRGASTANFHGFPTDFPLRDGSPAPTKRLTLNRRSGPAVLAVANAIRTRLHRDPGPGRLRPIEGAIPGSVELRLARTAEEEASWIADEVARRHREDGVPWREIAVLFRKNRHMSIVRDALESAGVPVEVASLGGLLSVPQVADLHAWLRALGRPDDSAALARILLGGPYRLGLGDLAPLAAWIREHRRGVEDDEGPGWPLVEAIDRLDEVARLSAEARMRLDEFASVYRELLVAAQAVTLAELCRSILEATHVWTEVDALEQAARLSARLNLYRFLDLAEEWSPLRGGPSLEAFLGYLDMLVEDRATDELDTARVSGEDAVALLTVHRAKGLEWDTVLLPALARSVFPATAWALDDPTRRASSVPYEIRLDAPPTDVRSAPDRDTLRAMHEAEEWRTAYVAATRARQRLVMTTAWWYTQKRHLEAGELYLLAQDVAGVTETVTAAEPGPPPDRLTPSPAPPPDPLFPSGWHAAVRATLADPDWPVRHGGVEPDAYHGAVDQIELLLDGLPQPPQPEAGAETADVSVTGLVTLAQCPRRFEWSEIDPLPRRRSRAQQRGIELHRLIELHNLGQVPFEELEDDLYDHPEPGTEDRVGDGYAAFLASPYGMTRPRWAETPIDVKLAAGRVRGRIDAVYERGDGSWEIVDFKSGRRTDDPARRVQLQAYAVAAAEGALDPAPAERMSVSFVYLGGSEADVETETVDAAWIDRARAELGSLLEGVRRDVYEPTPGPACHTCDFTSFCDEGRAHLDAAAVF